MPISNGYEACKNILKLFSDKKIFGGNFSPGMSGKNLKEDLELKPIMVAASAYVDDQVIEDTKKAGFDLVAAVPLKGDYIITNILPLIEERETKLNQKQNILTFAKEKKSSTHQMDMIRKLSQSLIRIGSCEFSQK